MAAIECTRIFISYAHKDAIEIANRLEKDLLERNCEVWLDKRRLLAGSTWSKEIESALDEAEIILAVLTPGSYVSEICRAEQLRALRKDKCVIPLRADKKAEVPLHLEAKQYLDFSAPNRYSEELNQLLESMRARSGVTLKEKYRQTYVTAPPMPMNYVERPEPLARLRNSLLAEGGDRHVALTALHGMGGIGKTVLAQAICHDEVVQQAFPDGIIWVNVGREQTYDLVSKMREIAKVLGDDLEPYDTEEGATNRYRSVLRDKAALIVLDDIWNTQDVERFCAESPRSRLLFTTRDSSIAAAVGAREQLAELLDEQQSRAVLAEWTGLSADFLPAQAHDLISECGRLPLALAVVGALLRGAGREEWSDTVELLRSADISAIEEQLPTGQKSFFRAIQVSFEALTREMRERYRMLAVLLEKMSAPLSILETLWGVKESEARRISRHFVERSLAVREDVGGGIRLHDLQLDYVRAEYPDREALKLIHGAMRLSSHVITRDPSQFATQVYGRLLRFAEQNYNSTVRQFVARVAKAARRPWIRVLQPTLHAPGTGLIRTLEGHSDYVAGVAVSPDGRLAISASLDNTLKIWDLENARQLHTLEGHSDSVLGVAVSPDGLRVISASRDNTLKVWDLESGRQLQTLEGHADFVLSVAVSPDARRVVSASYDGTLKIWDLESGRQLQTLEGHADSVVAVAVGPDGRRALSASYDKTLKVWDLESGRQLQTLEGHADSVIGVAVSPDGRRAVSASYDKTLKVWDLENGRQLHALEGHTASVGGVAIGPDGRRAISASYDKTLKVWDRESGRQLHTLEGHSASVVGVAMSPDGRLATSASYDNTLKVWDLESGCELQTLKGHSSSVVGVAISPDGRRAVSASWDKTLKVWDLESGCELQTLKGHSSSVVGVMMSPDGRRAVSASYDKTIRVWDLENGSQLHTLEGHADSVVSVAVSPDGSRGFRFY